ncbi:MAG: hypothetical protein J2P58_02805 [Acidimicrobiaceae bacterium]|nr:hypothetical protein [Acidimicrobiaceae bacterium]
MSDTNATLPYLVFNRWPGPFYGGFQYGEISPSLQRLSVLSLVVRRQRGRRGRQMTVGAAEPGGAIGERVTTAGSAQHGMSPVVANLSFEVGDPLGAPCVGLGVAVPFLLARYEFGEPPRPSGDALLGVLEPSVAVVETGLCVCPVGSAGGSDAPESSAGLLDLDGAVFGGLAGGTELGFGRLESSAGRVDVL